MAKYVVISGPYFPVFNPNTGKYGPELTTYLDTFHTVLYLWISEINLLNFADDNSISAASNTIQNLISTLEQGSQTAIDWFKINEMIVNPKKLSFDKYFCNLCK